MLQRGGTERFGNTLFAVYEKEVIMQMGLVLFVGPDCLDYMTPPPLLAVILRVTMILSHCFRPPMHNLHYLFPIGENPHHCCFLCSHAR